jgi:adenine-specific DNA-methyltransferase
MSDVKRAIQEKLQQFATGSLADNARSLFETLGYRIDKSTSLDRPTAQSFLNSFADGRSFNRETALVKDWQFVDLLFQLTKDEITGSNQLRIAFGDSSRVDNTIIESYLFFAIALKDSTYTRTQLAGITREINKLFPMPVMLVFLHGQTLTLSIINRRLHKRDESKDVLEKVTLIKDIAFANPHRAHIEILFDLSLEQLYKAHKFTNFVELHQAWQKTLDSSELNKRFFREVSNWYFWATQHVAFPAGAETDEEVRNATSVIRMITRLIFVWFLKEKSLGDKPLVPEELFQEATIKQLIHYDEPSSYYKAILQNLFFATLNQEMNTPEKPENRKFRHKGKTRDQHYMVHNLYRYEALFKQPEEALKLFEQVPFLNGGLFECLDHADPNNSKQTIRVDGFSDRPDNPLSVPNYLFFCESKKQIDLNEIYGTKNKKYEVRGLINIFNSYKFTITENTPIEEEIALDPELLGKVFENLLAAYNSETRVTARKQTGSFYTPREVVDYMVDESLLVYLATQVMEAGLVDEADRADLEQRLRQLLDYKSDRQPFEPQEVVILIRAIDQLKSLDPAVGSGAFPMGLLQKLVFILGKLDPNNEQWKHQQKEREILPLLQDIQQADQISYEAARKAAINQLQERLQQIEADFRDNEMDYPRKLFLIENCIYGVDIQPIAVQIAKLRFFISLIVEQRVNENSPNRGILPLPNLETKFIAANTLMSIDRPQQLLLRDPQIEEKENELKKVRHEIFKARTQRTKQKYRDRDQELRAEISELLKTEGWSDQTAQKIAQWNPYDQNASATFFDSEWMFGVKEGFDVVIANPPYVRQEQIKHLKEQFKQQFECFTGTADLYVYFYERGLKLLKERGVLTFISSNKYFRAAYGQKLRQFLTNQSQIHQIIDFGDAPVFTAIAYPTIVITERAKTKESTFRALNWEMGKPIEQFELVVEQESFWMPQKELRIDGWQFAADTSLRLLERIRRAGMPLGEYVNGRFYYGIKTGFNEAFVVNRATRDRLIAEHSSSEEVLRPFLRGRDVKRWRIDNPDLWLLFIPWHFPLHEDPSIEGASSRAEKEFEKKYPAIYNHLFQFKEQLSNRNQSETGIRYEWYALQRCAASYWQEFEKYKIVYPDIARKCEFTFDTNQIYPDCTLFIIPDVPIALLGILNSKLVEFFFKRISPSVRGDFMRFKSIYVEQIPIPIEKLPRSFSQITNYIFLLHKENQRNVDSVRDKLMLEYFEQVINGLVYELYLPEDLHLHGFTFANHLQAENLPALDDIKGDKLEALRTIFHRLYAQDHPIRQNLFALDTLPVIRLIEGKA